MIVKQTFGVLFMAMNPLLMVGLFLYIALGVKDFSSRKHRLYDVDNLLRLLTIVGALSIFLLLPKFYPAYLIDVVPFMAIGAARGFSQAWNNRGVSKGLRVKSAKISVTISEHRVRALLCVGCIIIVGGSAVVYNSYVAFEPTLKRLGKTNNEITDAVVDYIQVRTKPDERIFTIDHIFAALSQRRIVGEVSTGIQIRSVWQLDECPYAGPQEIIALMRNGEGRYVIMDPHTSKTLKNWAPDLLDYIISAYIVEKVVEDVEIMGRTT
jgi:hypothetical protein